MRTTEHSHELPKVLGSDLGRLDALADEDIDYGDAPVPDLADWVRQARPFRALDLENDCGG